MKTKSKGKKIYFPTIKLSNIRMFIKKIKFLLFAFVMACTADYGVTTNTVEIEEIQPSESGCIGTSRYFLLYE